MTHARNRYSLIADIGGTNTRVALAEGTQLLPDTIHRYRNAEHAGLADVLALFLADQGGVDCAGACAAAAGPVQDGRAQLTNLDWVIDAATLAKATRAEHVAVLNDLQAQGFALGHLKGDALSHIIDRPTPEKPATMLVIGVGTGFNCAPVYLDGQRRLVAPAEAGHASLPVQTGDERALAAFLAGDDGFASVEDALSGRGLAHIYGWLATRTGHAREATAAEVMQLADSGDVLARETLALFASLLGRVTGDLALIHLPFGGIFLAGGVSRAVGPWLRNGQFTDAMYDKGRFSDLTRVFPVSVIEDDFAALTGCAHFLAQAAG